MYVAWSRVPEEEKRRVLRDYQFQAWALSPKLIAKLADDDDELTTTYCPFGALLEGTGEPTNWPGPDHAHDVLVRYDWDGGPVTREAVARFMRAWDSGKIKDRAALAHALGVKPE